jgi:hypothetical protein
MKEWPPNNDLRRAPLLQAQVEIAVAEGDLETARAASEELQRTAAAFESKALEASSAQATARVLLAEGSSEAAGAFRTAIRLWSEISAPYEVAVARLGLSQAHRAAGFDEGADIELAAARSALERIGALKQTELARPDAVGAHDGAADANRFSSDVDMWTLAFDGAVTHLRDAKGLRYLARLLSDPGREFHVVDLVASGPQAPDGPAPSHDDDLQVAIDSDAGELLDDRAKEVYRRRLADIEDDIEEARTFGDAERVSRATSEKEFIVRELARAVGLRGRDRRAGATSERARAAVTRAIRNAMKRIEEHHPRLGEHLERTVRTGTYCSYMPDPAVEWETSS